MISVAACAGDASAMLRLAGIYAQGQSGLPRDVEASRMWLRRAAEAGHRVVYAAQHLHGGIGFDADYPLHRHYLWSKQIELTLGSASVHLARLGAEIAGSR